MEKMDAMLIEAGQLIHFHGMPVLAADAVARMLTRQDYGGNYSSAMPLCEGGKSITVVLDKDMREDDCQNVIAAIGMIRGVLSAKMHVADLQSPEDQNEARRLAMRSSRP